jgi:hypothetical protein
MLAERSKRGTRLCLVAATGLWLIAGCGGDGPQEVSVRGTVRYRGQPVEGAAVKFWSAAGDLHAGTTDTAGKFQFDVNLPVGAEFAEFGVAVSKQERVSQSDTADDPYAPAREVLPVRYANRAQSGLRAKVTLDGENSFDFNLEDR